MQYAHLRLECQRLGNTYVPNSKLYLRLEKVRPDLLVQIRQELELQAALYLPYGGIRHSIPQTQYDDASAAQKSLSGIEDKWFNGFPQFPSCWQCYPRHLWIVSKYPSCFYG